jgi:folate-binding protein YgfZ
MAKASSLTPQHRANGATFREENGWLLPAHFDDPTSEYRAVRDTVGLLDLSHRGLLQFTGPDRLSFLQGMLSNDLRALKTFDGQYATLLTQQGKVIADVRVLCAMNSFYLDFWEPLREKILAHLNRYLIADEVEIADRTEEYATLSLQGPKSEALLRALVGNAEVPQRAFGHVMVQLEGAAICVVAASSTGEPGFDLIIPIADLEKIARRLSASGEQHSLRWIGAEAQEILRVEAGIPLYGVDFTEDNLLLEVGLDHAVSFSKGCYLGQEVVERIRSRGHVNKKLSGLLLEAEEPAKAGSIIEANGKSVGTITSSVLSPRLNRPIALGYVSKEFWTPGAQVSVRSGAGESRATVAVLPFPLSS